MDVQAGIANNEKSRADRTKPPRRRSRKSATSGRQYTIKRIDDETLDLVRKAARLEGKLIGVWVGESLRHAAKLVVHPGKPMDLEGSVRNLEDNVEALSSAQKLLFEELQEITKTQRSILQALLTK